MHERPDVTLYQQIFWGSVYLGACLFLQVIFLALAEAAQRKTGPWLSKKRRFVEVSATLMETLIFIVTAHTVQVWLWATVYIFKDVLPDWNSAIYFSLVTYTALGYGDIVLGPGVRIFAGFAAVTGLLGFGISTAYLVALMNRVSR